MPPPLPLTTTSYLVLGLVGSLEPVTSCEMKQHVGRSIGYFWNFPHSQLYAEPIRLEAVGLLTMEIAPTGRKHKRYRITEQGRLWLRRWLAEPIADPTEIRDLGLLKLFFGALATEEQREALATEQHRAHRQRRKEYETLWSEVKGLATPQELATLDMGLRFERAAEAFWGELARPSP
jgi:DNA-binding PadR family transcriptional regulator